MLDKYTVRNNKKMIDELLEEVQDRINELQQHGYYATLIVTAPGGAMIKIGCATALASLEDSSVSSSAHPAALTQ